MKMKSLNVGNLKMKMLTW